MQQASANLRDVVLRVLQICIVMLLLNGEAEAQRDTRLVALGGATGGLVLARMQYDIGGSWSQLPGTALIPQAGLGIRYRERFAIHASAGYSLSTFSFSNGSSRLNILYGTWHAGVGAYTWIPLSKRHSSYIHLGGMYMRVFRHGDRIDHARDTYRSTAVSYGPSLWSVQPELGVTKQLRRASIQLILTARMQIEPNDAVVIQLSDISGHSFEARSRANHAGLHVRYCYDILGHKEPAMHRVADPEEHEDFVRRASSRNQRLIVSSRTARLRIWDNGEIDGDSISIQVNGVYVLTHYPLERKPARVKLRLHRGKNEVVVMAHNLGTIPPNTARCELRSGLRRYSFGISTDLRRNEVIEIEVN